MTLSDTAQNDLTIRCALGAGVLTIDAEGISRDTVEKILELLRDELPHSLRSLAPDPDDDLVDATVDHEPYCQIHHGDGPCPRCHDARCDVRTPHQHTTGTVELLRYPPLTHVRPAEPDVNRDDARRCAGIVDGFLCIDVAGHEGDHTPPASRVRPRCGVVGCRATTEHDHGGRPW